MKLCFESLHDTSFHIDVDVVLFVEVFENGQTTFLILYSSGQPLRIIWSCRPSNSQMMEPGSTERNYIHVFIFYSSSTKHFLGQLVATLGFNRFVQLVSR